MLLQNRQLQAVLRTAKNGRISIRSFRHHFPRICDQIRQDAQTDVFRYWGLCSNRDEPSLSRITDRKLLNVIGRLARRPIRTAAGYHAGLMHTYGYLLSTLKTRYGYKHERWTTGIIENGLRLEEVVFDPLHSRGSLLQNATFLIGGITLREHPKLFRKMQLSLNAVHPELSTYNFCSLNIDVLREKVRLPGLGTLTLETYIAHLPLPTPDASALVCYTTSKPGKNTRELVTCFPVSQAGVDEIFSTMPVTRSANIRLRFNARVEGITTGIMQGKRSRQTIARTEPPESTQTQTEC